MKSQIAIQLFSVRRELYKDPVGTLKKLREIGYTAVEMAGYNGLPPAYFKGIFDTLGITAVSGHLSKETVENDPYKIINDCKMFGSKYLAIPYLYGHFHPDGECFSETVEFFNKTGKLFSENGIRLLYHNHDTEFSKKVNGDYMLDVFYNSVDREYVQAEIDTCWASYKGVDVPNYIRKFRNRLPVIHLKDYVTYDAEEGGETVKRMHTCALGDGELDLANIIKASKSLGVELYVVEQDEPYGDMDIFECLKCNFDRLNSILAE